MSNGSQHLNVEGAIVIHVYFIHFGLVQKFVRVFPRKEERRKAGAEVQNLP